MERSDPIVEKILSSGVDSDNISSDDEIVKPPKVGRKLSDHKVLTAVQKEVAMLDTSDDECVPKPKWTHCPLIGEIWNSVLKAELVGHDKCYKDYYHTTEAYLKFGAVTPIPLESGKHVSGMCI